MVVELLFYCEGSMRWGKWGCVVGDSLGRGGSCLRRNDGEGALGWGEGGDVDDLGVARRVEPGRCLPPPT